MGLWLVATPWRNFAQEASTFWFVACFLITANWFPPHRLPDFLQEKKTSPHTCPYMQGLDVPSLHREHLEEMGWRNAEKMNQCSGGAGKAGAFWNSGVWYKPRIMKYCLAHLLRHPGSN